MNVISYPNTNIYITNGYTGTTITPTYITTPSINAQRISTILGNSGSPGNILSKTNDNIAWIASSISGNIGSSNLDMQTNNITNANTISCTTIDPTTISTTTFANQTSFTTTPISYYPTASTHLATKSYVDNKLLTNKNYYLYLNKSEPITLGGTGYYTLSTTITGETGQGITGTTVTNTNTLIGSFMTPALNITNIPPSLWILNLYCGVQNANAVFTTFFELYKYTTTGSASIIGTSSSTAGDINSTITSNYPSLYKMTLSISSYNSLLITDRLFIKLYYYTTNTSMLYYTYYENNWYSYLEILSNLSSVLCGSDAYSNLNMNSFNITSTGNMSISCPNTILSLGNKASTINIGTDKSVTTNINLGLTGTNNIFLNSQLTPNYTRLPGEGEIGQIINFPRVLGKTGISSLVFDMNYTLPYKGRWFITSTFGIYISASTTINDIYIYLYTTADNSPIISEYSHSKYNGIISSIGYCNIVNVSGIIDNSMSIPGFRFSCRYGGADPTKCFTYNDPSDLYIVQAVRLA